MKQRFGYVSNSSSSSFIIGHDDVLDGIGEKGIYDVLASLYKDFQKAVEEYRKYVEEHNLEKDDFSPMCVYDLSYASRREEGKKNFGWLSSWISSDSLRNDDGIVERSDEAYEHRREWALFVNRMSNKEYAGGYRLWMSDGTTLDTFLDENGRDFVMHKYDFENDRNLHRRASARTVRAVADKWKSLGLVNNMEVLMSENAKYFIHFDDNAIYNIEGMMDEDGGYKTESWSGERFIEILVSELKRRGLVPDSYDYKTLMEKIMTCNMHEG